jgi:hypothetical protein
MVVIAMIVFSCVNSGVCRGLGYSAGASPRCSGALTTPYGIQIRLLHDPITFLDLFLCALDPEEPSLDFAERATAWSRGAASFLGLPGPRRDRSRRAWLSARWILESPRARTKNRKLDGSKSDLGDRKSNLGDRKCHLDGS